MILLIIVVSIIMFRYHWHIQALKERKFAEETDRFILELTQGRLVYEGWDDYEADGDDIVWPDEVDHSEGMDIEHEDWVCDR